MKGERGKVGKRGIRERKGEGRRNEGREGIEDRKRGREGEWWVRGGE